MEQVLWPGETLEEYFSYLIKEPGITYDKSLKLNWIYPEFHYRKFEKGEQRPDGKVGIQHTDQPHRAVVDAAGILGRSRCPTSRSRR